MGGVHARFGEKPETPLIVPTLNFWFKGRSISRHQWLHPLIFLWMR